MIGRKIAGITAFLITMVFLLPMQFCLGSEKKLSAEKEAAKTIAKIAISRLQEKAKKLQIDRNYLSKKMSDNPANYQARKSSWEKLQTEKERSFLKWYQEEVELILKGLNRDRPEDVGNYFTKKELESFLECPRTVTKTYLGRNFGESYNPKDQTTIFAKARKKTCDEQLNKLICNVYPTEVEVETIETVGRSQLKNKLLDKLIKSQRESPFEENEKLLGENFIDPILDDAEAQLEKQKNIVKGSYGGGFIVPDEIKSFIETEINSYRHNLEKEKKEKKISNKTYQMFPSVQKTLENRANNLAIERFSDTLSKTSSPIGQKAIKELIESNLSSHANKNKSWRNCLGHFGEKIVQETLNNYVLKAPEDKQSAFREFLNGLLSTDKSCQEAGDGLVSRSLEQDFKKAREEISKKQFERFFKPLAGGSWKPSEKEIYSWYNKFLKITEPLGISDVSSGFFDSETLLEETIDKVRKAEEKSIQKGLTALKDQMSLTERLQSQVKKETEQISELSIEKIINLYTQKVKSAWSDSDYPDLFEHTLKEIEEKAKNIFPVELARRDKERRDKKQQDALAKAARAQAVEAGDQFKNEGGPETFTTGGGKQQDDTRKPKGPGGTDNGRAGNSGDTGGGEGPGKEQKELGDEMPDVILDFGYENRRVYADIMFLKESEDKLRLFIDLNVNLDSTNMVIARKLFTDWLQDVIKRSEKDQQEINLYVFARVFHGDSVLYSMVYYFRECLIKALKDAGDKRIKIHWYDRLFDQPNDIEKYKGRPILPPNFEKRIMPRLLI